MLAERLVDWDYVHQRFGRSDGDQLWNRRWDVLCGIVENYQTRTLVGTSLGARPFGPGRGEADVSARLQQAIATMLRFRLMLVLEDVGATNQLLSPALGWSKTELPHENVQAADGPLYYDTLAEHELQLLRECNAIDMKLYDAARAMQRLDLLELYAETESAQAGQRALVP